MYHPTTSNDDTAAPKKSRSNILSAACDRIFFEPISDALRAELDDETEALKDALGPHIDFFAGKRAQRSF